MGINASYSVNKDGIEFTWNHFINLTHQEFFFPITLLQYFGVGSFLFILVGLFSQNNLLQCLESDSS